MKSRLDTFVKVGLRLVEAMNAFAVANNETIKVDRYMMSK